VPFFELAGTHSSTSMYIAITLLPYTTLWI
jgi:hypothetical protein